MGHSSRLGRAVRLATRFLLVGGLSTIIEIASFNALVYAAGWNQPLAKIAASTIALGSAYFGNRQWTFRGRRGRGRRDEITWFVGVNVVCGLVGAAVVWAGVAGLSAWLHRPIGPVTVNIVNLVSIVLVVVLRFGLYNRYVFRRTEASPPLTLP